MQPIPISPLGQFFGSYLNQDWPEEYGNAWSAVEDYVALEPLNRRSSARRELVELLSRCGSEEQLMSAADQVYLNYHPPFDGFSYREWLEKVERYLADHED